MTYMHQYDDAYFTMKNELGVLTEKTVRDLKFSQMSWKDRVFLDVSATNANLQGPQEGAVAKDYQWYTQKEMWEGGYWDYHIRKVICDERVASGHLDTGLPASTYPGQLIGSSRVEDSIWNMDCDEELWDNWETMHTDVLWYDTAACYNAAHVDPFNMPLLPTNNNFGSPGQWFKDSNGDATFASTSPAPVQTDSSDSKWNRIDYSTDINVVSDPRNTQKDISIWLKRLKLEIADTCDIDCMARGSMMTVVAVLNTISLSIIALNAFIMVMGAFTARDRVCSVFFTMFACVFQFIVLMVSAGILFSPFARLCGYSTEPVGGYPVMSLVAGKDWMMMDDYWTMVGLWAAQIFLMFAFCVIGAIPAFKATGTPGNGASLGMDWD